MASTSATENQCLDSINNCDEPLSGLSFYNENNCNHNKTLDSTNMGNSMPVAGKVFQEDEMDMDDTTRKVNICSFVSQQLLR